MANNPEIDLSNIELTAAQVDEADWLACFMSLNYSGYHSPAFGSVLRSLQQAMEIIGIDRGEDGSIPESARIAAGLIMNEFDYDVTFPKSVAQLAQAPYCSSPKSNLPVGGYNGQ